MQNPLEALNTKLDNVCYRSTFHLSGGKEAPAALENFKIYKKILSTPRLIYLDWLLSTFGWYSYLRSNFFDINATTAGGIEMKNVLTNIGNNSSTIVGEL